MRTMIKKIGVALAIIFISSASFAAPNITILSSSLGHGDIITISGTGFGFKNPAAPLLWDDSTSSPSLSTYYDAWLPINAQQGSQFNMAYRTVPFRGLTAPHKRINHILAGAHALDNQAGSYSIGGNVGVGKNITSHSYFINYYYRVDPNFDEENHPLYGENLKEIVLSGVTGAFYTDSFPPGHGYAAWCISDVPDVNSKGPMRLERMPIDPTQQNAPYGCSGNNLVYHINPINGWVKMQWEGAYNYQYDAPQISLTTYPDGQRTYLSHYGDGLTVTEYARGNYPGYPKLNDLKFIGLGGFARVPRMNNGVNSFRYFAAVYIDNTRARAMLGDKQDYASCTIMEPQIPVSWDDTSIAVKVNLGALPDTGTAYLFIFDASNNRNPLGHPVTLGGSSPQDTMPPAVPLLMNN